MTYRLKKSEAVPEGLKRIVFEEIDSASGELARSEHRETAIHEARKSLKKIRGVMRLVQPELGRIYRFENQQIGAIGRKLSELRDAAASLEIFDSLVGTYGGNLRENALASVRHGLENSKRDIEQTVNVAELIEETLATLRIVRDRVESWPLEHDGFSALAPGLKNRYRRGRRAMTVALKEQTADSYHEWRKRVKDHWYHLRLLQATFTKSLKAQETHLKDLETWLGDDHNLTVLCAKVEQNPELFGEAADRNLFLALSAQRRKELRENAHQLGAHVYRKKPREIVSELKELWDAWHATSSAAPKKGVQREQAKARKQTAA